MTTSRHHHLAAGDLRSLLDSQLAPQVEQVCVQHLETCEECRALLERTAGSHSWWNEAREFLTDELTFPLQDGESVPQEIADRRMAQRLDHILVRSDDPRMIGRISNYQIAGVIGQGGTGIVLKGFDASLDRFVAIKVLTPELAIMGAARERFQREARAAAAVTHENVIPIHAVSEFQGHSYIVMQYVPGHSLEQRIRRSGPLELVEILRIALQVARALGAAHEQGLVHRDIKPANILLEHGIDRPIVTDFGLARVANEASLTQSGMLAGTPNYMSPEQASGAQVDARSDLFSLGSVMYAMCVGHPPFRADTLVGVIRRVCDHQPRSLRTQNSRLPEWMEPFIFKLLEKEPDDRFASAEEVAEQLSAELAYCQNPTLQQPPARYWWHQPPRRLKSITACALLTACVVVTAVAVFLMPGDSRQPSRQESAPVSQSNDNLPDTPAPDTADWDATMSATIRAAEEMEAAWGSPVLEPFLDPWDEAANEVERQLHQLESDEL